MIATSAKQLIKMALAEDIGRGDITARAIVDSELRAKAKIIAKEEIVLAGIDVARQVFKEIEKNVKWKALRRDGDICKKGDVLAEIEGHARTLISGERTALNFLQHLSGIATLTKKFVDAASGSKTKILDTRKTTPGLRLLEKYAVKMGGGTNHRFGLFDGLLIKNNHISIAGSINEAMRGAMRGHKSGQKIEIEVRTVADMKEALASGADIVMLDNMAVDEVRKAVESARGRVKLEASGNISLANVAQYAATGVDFISVGALTHSAPAADINMLIEVI